MNIQFEKQMSRPEVIHLGYLNNLHHLQFLLAGQRSDLSATIQTKDILP
jgi:hypothetical protein